MLESMLDNREKTALIRAELQSTKSTESLDFMEKWKQFKAEGDDAKRAKIFKDIFDTHLKPGGAGYLNISFELHTQLTTQWNELRSPFRTTRIGRDSSLYQSVSALAGEVNQLIRGNARVSMNRERDEIAARSRPTDAAFMKSVLNDPVKFAAFGDFMKHSPEYQMLAAYKEFSAPPGPTAPDKAIQRRDAFAKIHSLLNSESSPIRLDEDQKKVLLDEGGTLLPDEKGIRDGHPVSFTLRPLVGALQTAITASDAFKEFRRLHEEGKAGAG
jgi:hypothetical protein